MPFYEREPGVRIHFTIDDYVDPWRDSEWILMHHGVAQNLRRWRSWVPYVAREFRIVRVDFRGFGESTIPPDDSTPTLETLLEDSRGLLRHLNIERVHFVGASTGGMVGMLYASRYPGEILSLTLVNTIPGMAKSPANLKEWESFIDEKGVRALFTAQVSDRFAVDRVPQAAIDWFIEDWSKVNAGWLKRMLRAVSLDISDCLTQIACPTLILWGEKDEVLPRPTQLLMVNSIPNAEFQIVRGHAHNIFEVAGDECGMILAKFLDAVGNTRVKT